MYVLRRLLIPQQKPKLGRMRPSSHGLDIPCFPDNKTGLILIFTPKFTLWLIFGDVLFWYIKKLSYKVKIKRILNKQKLRKTIHIYLPLTCFLFRNSLTTNFSKKSYHHHRFPKFQRRFPLTQFPQTFRQSIRACFKSTAYIKIILKNHARSYYRVGLVIGETL